MIPPIHSIERAIDIYGEKLTLSAEDIQSLFARQDGRRLSSKTVAKLRSLARQYADDNNIPRMDPTQVYTDAAYSAWGIDIDTIIKRYQRMQKIRK